MDINQLIESDHAFDRIVLRTFDLLDVCGCKHLMVMSPRSVKNPQYTLTLSEDILELTFQRESVSSKYRCARYTRVVTANGNQIPENDRRFLKMITEILGDIRDHKAEMFTPSKGEKL